MMKINILVISILSSFVGMAQVTQLGLGFGGSLMDYEIDQTGRIWVGVDVSGLYASDDNGQSWFRMNNQTAQDHVSEIFVHPDDENLVLLGTRGSLNMSTDRGETWVDVESDAFPNKTSSSSTSSMAIQTIVCDPQNTDIIYFGVGDRRDASKAGWDQAQEKYGRGLIFKSTDRAKTWVNLRESYEGDIPSNANIFQLVVGNEFSKLLFAATSRGLYRSKDGGENWTRQDSGLPHERVTAVAFNPDNNYEVYVTVLALGNKHGVYKSTDMGETFTEATTGIPYTYEEKDLKPWHLQVDWKDPNTVYMASTEAGAIWKTTNAGVQWENTYRGKVRDHGWGSYGPNFLKAYGFDLSPLDNQFLIAGEHWSHRSTDGGANWFNVYSNSESPYVHTGVDFTVSDYVKASPSVDGLVFMAQYDNGLYRSTDGGLSWENQSFDMRKDIKNRNGDKQFLVAVTDIEFATNNHAYAAIDISVYTGGDGYVIKKSDDNGASWNIVLDGTKHTNNEYAEFGIYHNLEVHPTDEKIVYVTSMDSKGYAILKSTDAGVNWTKLGTQFPNNRVRQLLLDKQHPDTIYAVASAISGSNGRIYKSTDAGVNWTTINTTELVDPRDLTIDPSNSNTLYVAVTPSASQGGIHKSVDGGVTWTPLLTKDAGTKSALLQQKLEDNANIFGATAVVVHPDNSNVILASLGSATGQIFGNYRPPYGLGISKDGGTSWRVIGESDIRYGRLSHLEFDPKDSKYLYAGSGGAGGFKIDLTELIAKDDALNVLRAYATANDADDLTVQELEDAGFNDVSESNLATYKSILASLSGIQNLGQVQHKFDSAVSGSTDAASQVLELIANGYENVITSDLLVAAGVDSVFAHNLYDYQKEIREVGGITDIAALESLIKGINKNGLDKINRFALTSDTELIGFGDLESLGLENLIEGKLGQYAAAIADESEITNLSMLQEIINEQNDLDPNTPIINSFLPLEIEVNKNLVVTGRNLINVDSVFIGSVKIADDDITEGNGTMLIIKVPINAVTNKITVYVGNLSGESEEEVVITGSVISALTNDFEVSIYEYKNTLYWSEHITEMSLRLSTLSGKIVWDGEINPLINSISLPQVPSGMYVLRFLTDGNYQDVKVVLGD